MKIGTLLVVFFLSLSVGISGAITWVLYWLFLNDPHFKGFELSMSVFGALTFLIFLLICPVKLLTGERKETADQD